MRSEHLKGAVAIASAVFGAGVARHPTPSATWPNLVGFGVLAPLVRIRCWLNPAQPSQLRIREVMR